MKSPKIAEIVPVSLLDYTKQNAYHMCLAQLVLKNRDYALFYRDRALEGKYVILDNGAAEGEEMDFEDLLEAYSIVKPSEIILPDVLKDSRKTCEKTIRFYEKQWETTMNYNTMVVPQGKDLGGWINCFVELANTIPFTCVGVPKWLGANGSLDRVKAVEYLSRYNVEVHLLGCNENPSIIKRCHEVNGNVRGCDSAFAYLCDKAEMTSIDESTERPDEVIDFLNDTKTSNLRSLMHDFEMCAGVTNNKED